MTGWLLTFLLLQIFLRDSVGLPVASKCVMVSKIPRRSSYLGSGSTDMEYAELWRVRRKMVRTAVTPILKAKESDIDDRTESVDVERKSLSLKQSTLLTVSLVAITAAVLRVGGRAALVSVLGLDFVNNVEIKDNLDKLLEYFQGLGVGTTYTVFILSWLLVKTLCIDFLTIILAISSGIIFGGFWEGTVATVIASTLASSVNFQMSRIFLRDKVRAYINTRSSLRSIDRACQKDGFKTVLSLRLSPVLPIPIAAYSYLYGATSIRFLDFVFGLSLGSIKPYAFDCYLGLLSKSIIDDNSTDSDPFILAGVTAIILVGILSSQLASSIYEELISDENKDKEGGQDDEGNIQDDIFKFIGGLVGMETKPTKSSGDFSVALDRISRVVDDEILSIHQELSRGQEIQDNAVSWDGKLLYTGILSVSNSTDSIMNYIYPGTRKLQEFEDGADFATNKPLLYVFESLLFSFVLLAKLSSAAFHMKRIGAHQAS